MTRTRSLIMVGLVAVLAVPAAFALPPYLSEVVGFNGPPINDPADSTEMFQHPQFSGTTNEFIVANESDPNLPAFSFNAAYRASGDQTEGDAGLKTFFNWTDANDPDAWLRLTTFNGPERPNPALHQGGMVKFKLYNRSQLFFGEIGICLGIRETATEVAQLEDGGTSGTIEWVGVDETINAIIAGPNGIVNSIALGDDEQVYPLNYNLNNDPDEPNLKSAVILPGPNGTIDSVLFGDDEFRYGYYIAWNNAERPIPAVTLPPDNEAYDVTFDLATGDVAIGDPNVPGNWTLAGITPFTGDGELDPNARGTLEHIAFTSQADGATLIDVTIDELVFASPVPDPTPPPSIQAPVAVDDLSVLVDCIEEATEAELFINDISAGTETPVNGVATFNVALSVGDILTATQTANELTSPPSSPVVVYEAGTALDDSFDFYQTQEDLEGVWSQTDPSFDRQVYLAQGSAASCESYVSEVVPSGDAVSRLYYDLGSVNGSDAEPLVVTYHFKHDTNNANGRVRFELTSALTRDFGAVGFAFTNGVATEGYGTQYTTMTNSPTPIIEGYESDYFNYDYALTGIDRVAGVWHKMQIEVLSDVVNFYIDNQLANPVDPNDGTPIWPDGVPRVDLEPYRYIVIGVGYSTNGTGAMYDNVKVTVGGNPTIPTPVSVTSPSVEGPLYPMGTEVTVTNIDPNAVDVAVYADWTLVANVDPAGQDTVTLTVPGLTYLDPVHATQTLGATESCFSAPVTVDVPAPTVFPVLAPGQEVVQVVNIEEGLADKVTVYRYLAADDIQFLGDLNNPALDPADVEVPPLVEGEFVVATQTIGGIESPISEPVEVREPGILTQWIETTPLPWGTTGHRLVYSDGYIYCIGGRTNESDASTYAVDNVYYTEVQPDGSIGPWIETTPLPVDIEDPGDPEDDIPGARAAHGAAAYEGRIYVWGGWTEFYPTRNECFYADQQPDGSLGAWTISDVTIPNDPALPADPLGRRMDSFGNGMLRHDNHLYILNGEQNDGSQPDVVLVSTIQPDGDFGPWIETTNTPLGTNEPGSWFHGTGVMYGTTNDYFYRIAANFGATYSGDSIKAPINPDGTVGEWTQCAAILPQGRYEFANAIVDNKWVFAVDGLFGSTTYNSTYYAAINPDNGEFSEWVQTIDYPLSLSRNAAISYKAGDKYYILVVSGGPYPRTGIRDERCFYAAVGRYHDLASFAEFQTFYEVTTEPSADAQRVVDMNNDQTLDFDDIYELEEYLIGPEE